MTTRDGTAKKPGKPDWGDISCEKFRRLSHRILEYGSRGTLRLDFLREVLEMLAVRSGCDLAEVRLIERGRYFGCRFTRETGSFDSETHPSEAESEGKALCAWEDDPVFQRLCRAVVEGPVAPSPHFAERGSFWISRSDTPFDLTRRVDGTETVETLRIEKGPKSFALFPLMIQGERSGVLLLGSSRSGYFNLAIVEFYEAIGETLAVSLAYRRAQVELRERVKELTCLYGISRLVEKPGIPLEDILEGAADLLAPGFLYPDIASARVVLDERSFSPFEFPEEGPRLASEITVAGMWRGAVEVAYTEHGPDLDEGPFLKEERVLIDSVARELALIVERKEAEEQKSLLEDQLRHADRLATIGQLVAGVAHELNEPLGNILGFAQLATKSPGLPGQAAEDLQRIVTSTLHAREVIRKLMIFARKMPPQKARVNLNQVVEEGLYFLEARCERAGIRLRTSLAPSLPEITADRAQIHQVLVNLVVNSVQAMPQGGRVTVETKTGGDQVCLVVKDTGVGMSDEVLRQVFIPFFTTKDVDEGTGLGLPVVHGIVSSHGGTIRVTSREGSGTGVEVRLPVAGTGNSNGEGAHVTVDR